MPQYERNNHCSYCGAPFAPNQPWPRKCPVCANISYLNPTPVAVVLVPVGDGVLVVRRGISPGKGGLALPGGFINFGESWQEAAARELEEETGLVISPRNISPIWVASAPDSTLIVFGLAEPVTQEALQTLHPGDETEEVMVVDQPVKCVFSLHQQLIHRYFEERQ